MVAVRLMTVAWLLFIVAAFIIANVIEMNTVRIDLRVWPGFNVADAAIVGGAMLIIWEGIRIL